SSCGAAGATAGTIQDGAVRVGTGVAFAGVVASAGAVLPDGTAGADQACIRRKGARGRGSVRPPGPGRPEGLLQEAVPVLIGRAAAVLEAIGPAGNKRFQSAVSLRLLKEPARVDDRSRSELASGVFLRDVFLALARLGTALLLDAGRSRRAGRR